MNQFIRDHFGYVARDEEGTQPPLEPSSSAPAVPRLRPADDGSGAPPGHGHPLRLGLPVRPGARRRARTSGTVGAGYTHAWLQAYLPGAGWVPFDPTNNLLGGTHLIRVGVARDPSQAAPISGSWFGESGDYLGMDGRRHGAAALSRRGSAMKTPPEGGGFTETPPSRRLLVSAGLSARSRPDADAAPACRAA